MFLKERQTACKPGSVPPEEVVLGRGWPFLWGARCRAPRATDPSCGAKVRPAFPRAGCLPLLLGLAPGGVFPAAAVAGGAVRSCRTVSPLPAARCSETDRRCTFCGTFPGVAPAGRYPAPYLRGARTFLPPHKAESGHPAVWHYKFGSSRRACQSEKGTSQKRAHGILWAVAPQPHEAGRGLCRESALL